MTGCLEGHTSTWTLPRRETGMRDMHLLASGALTRIAASVRAGGDLEVVCRNLEKVRSAWPCQAALLA